MPELQKPDGSQICKVDTATFRSIVRRQMYSGFGVASCPIGNLEFNVLPDMAKRPKQLDEPGGTRALCYRWWLARLALPSIR